ncbi:CHAT domain-containing tetratricopeptide repeat protein [uncultured Microscilla sp.]|uniref:CHAT domain-containing protein n=1 Tax=uncultured Microscilla sp. TaxID=432653 RepID=UPI0026187CCD|nr:CHAT domain-containing tetratricopeptide repeat protein [uncultured Microscilla sp.]
MKYLSLLFAFMLTTPGLFAQLDVDKRIHLADSLFDDRGDYKQALDYYYPLIDDFARKGDRKRHVIYQIKVIQCHYLLSKYDTALKIAHTLLKSLPKSLPRKFLYEGEVKTLMGEIYYKKGEYEVAKKSLHQAWKVLKYEFGAEVQLSTVYTVLGFVHEALEEFNLAFRYYKKALKLRKRVLGKYNQATASSYADLANLYFAQGDYIVSIGYDKKALGIKKQLYGAHHPEIALSYNNMASTYNTWGNYGKALKYHQKALAIREKVFGQWHLDVGQSYHNIGYTYMQKGAYNLALEYYQRYKTILQKLTGKHHPHLSSIYTNIGTVYVKKRQYEKALDYFEKNLWLLRSAYARQNSHFAEAYHNFAYVYRLKKDYQLALTYSQKTLDIAQQVFGKPHLYTARAFLNMGRVYAQLQKPTLASQYFSKAIYILKQVFGHKSSLLSVTAHELGKLYLSQQNYTKALPYLHKALVYGVPRFNKVLELKSLPALKDCPLDPFLVKILATKAQCFYQMYEAKANPLYLNQSIAAYELGYALLKKIGNSFLKTEDRINFNETVIAIRDGALKAYRQKYQVTQQPRFLRKMFECSEQFKASSLQSALNYQKALKAANIPPVYIIQEQGLRMDIDYWTKKVSNNPAKAAQHQDSLFEYNRRYEELIAAIETNYPAYMARKYKYEIAQLDEIQQRLAPQSVLLEYSLGEKSSYLFIITTTKVEVVSLAGRRQLQPLLNAYYGALENEENLPKFAQASHRLYRAMLQPAEAYVKDKKRLIVIAPSLESIPFEAIISQPPSAQQLKLQKFSSLAYLIKQYQISYHYSATLWYRSLGQTKVKPLSLLAFAPFSAGKPQVLSNQTRQLSDSLPETGIEVRAIFEMFKHQKLKAKAYLAATATKWRFMQQSNAYSIIHLASHSEANTRHAHLAKVRFAPHPLDTGNTSGILYSSEVYNLKINPDLLVLSSCESGVGKLAKGEGVLSLARGFLYAGARNIIFSLWEVNDAYTRQLMVAFYKELLAGKNYCAALQAAQQTRLNANQYLHPRHWAGFVMIGR